MIIQLRKTCHHYITNGYLDSRCIYCGRDPGEIIASHNEKEGLLKIKPNDGKGFLLWVKPHES